MALTDEVQDRYSSNFLVNLTNMGEAPASSINTSRLDKAILDVQAVFLTRVGEAYDNSIAEHVSVAVEGVILYLQKFSGLDTAELRETYLRWYEDLERLRQVKGNNRVFPTSSSVLVPSEEQPSGTTTVRPYFDDGHFTDFVLGDRNRVQ